MSEVSSKSPVLFSRIKGEDYDDGQIVMTIAGTITKLFPAKKGDTYEFQNGMIKDSEGTEIDICFSKNTQPETVKGKKVTIRSVKTEQHGWNGIKVEDQEFTPQGKDEKVKKRVLKVTATANIVYEGGAASGGDSKNSAGGQAGPSKTASNPTAHPELILPDLAALHGRCYQYALQSYPDVVAKENTAAVDLSALRQAATASFFIEACKMGLFIDFVERASKPIPPKIKPAPEDPKEWKTAMIPKGEMMGKTLNDLTDEQLTAFYDALKGKQTKLANCVEFGFEERGLLKKRQEAEAKQADEDQALNPPKEDDDVPF